MLTFGWLQLHDFIRFLISTSSCSIWFLYVYTCTSRRHETVLEQRMQHTTPRPLYAAIVESGVVKPNKNPRMPVDTILLNSSAPACAFFGTSVQSEKSIPIASFLPSHAEPGEMAAKVLISLDMFRQNRGEYKLYLCGVMAEDSRRRSSFRATVLFAREEYRKWCDEHLHALDEDSNPVIRFDKSSSTWEVATRVRVNGESRKLNVTITVPGGVRLGSRGADPVWMDVARIDWVCVAYLCGSVHAFFYGDSQQRVL